MTKKEVWKPISKNLYYMSSWIGDYEVSNLGNIRNKKTKKMIHPFFTQDKKKLKFTSHKTTRLNGDFTLQFLVDHVVYETFVGPCYGVPVYHRDGDNFNNAVENLYIKA